MLTCRKLPTYLYQFLKQTIIIILEVLIVYQVQDDIVSNHFAVSEYPDIKSCGTNFKVFSSLSSDVKGLSKNGGSMEPF